MRDLRVRVIPLLVIGLASAVLAQERRRAPPVPAHMLDGQRLVDKASGFSIAAPERWVWLAVPSTAGEFKNYAASDPNGGLGYAVNVVDTQVRWTTENANDLQIGMAKKLRSRGFTVEPLSFGPSDVPAPESYRFSWRVVLPDGTAMHRFGYALKHGSHILSFTCFADKPDEPRQFRVFVRSLRLL